MLSLLGRLETLFQHGYLQVFLEVVLMIEYVFRKFAIVGSTFSIIPMFTETSSEGVLGLPDVYKVAYLASSRIDYIFSATVTGIF